jgi:glutamyl-tRNA synthetase
VVRAQQERAATLAEMARISVMFYRDYDRIDADSARKHLGAAALEPLGQARAELEALPDWSPEAIHRVVKTVAERLDLKLGKVAQPLRVAVTGRAASPGIDITMHLVGREACMRRIDRVLAQLRNDSHLGSANV